MKEIWKDIPGYENLYQISNKGKIKSFYNYRRNGTNILTPKIKKGYYQIGLRKNGKRKWLSIHRLVAITFISNNNNFKCVNHKDENKLNNNVDNLEWCNHKYNNCYGTRIERVIKNNKSRKEILQYDLDGNFIKEFISIAEAARSVKTSAGNIISCCKGNSKYNKVKGYIWRYKGVVSQ